jgi:hypothetical protein
MFNSIYQDFPINKSNMELDNQQSILYSRNCNCIGFKQYSCGRKTAHTFLLEVQLEYLQMQFCFANCRNLNNA